MMSQVSSRRVVSQPAAAPVTVATTTYQIWLTEEQSALANAAIEKAGVAWAEWVRLAIERLNREDDVELRGILGGLKRTNREGKESVSFRLYASTLEEVKRTAKKFDSSVQAVLSTAFFMQALAPMIVLPDGDEFDQAH